MSDAAVDELREFLRAPTPQAWCEAAVGQLDLLLLDHANCEMKAAQTALAIVYRYPEYGALCQRLSRLAREELRHYEQVQRWLDHYGIERRKLGPARYAQGLLQHTASEDPARLRQRLVVGALIEARSCERFASLVPYLPAELAPFYAGLLASEARHFKDYLALATALPGAAKTLDDDIDRLLGIEAALITQPDSALRFHSGPPVSALLGAQTGTGRVPA